MLDRVSHKQTPFELAFREWWDAQHSSYRERMDVSGVRLAFRASYTSGHQKDLGRFIYKAGRFRITVWAKSSAEARAKAIADADFRASQRGWSVPKTGWSLEMVK